MNLRKNTKSEIRICNQCKLKIENPFIEKCPRCFNQLDKIEINCSSCYHKANCSLKKLINS